MNHSTEMEIVPVMVSSRILRHVSRGIYRTPAAALKELVSNSYDAAAKKVSIKTGHPTFESIVITDNGVGMSRKEFRNLIENIGLSTKTAGEVISVPGARNKRRVIGHYGIGLLAVGQLAGKMTVTSKRKGSTRGFVAELDFDQFEKKIEDNVERAHIIDESELEKQDKKPGKKKDSQMFRIGKCRIGNISYDAKDRRAHFTQIQLDAIRSEVKNKLAGKFRDDLNPKAKSRQKYSATFNDLLGLLRESEGEVRQGQYPYERLCWELAVYCPLQYPEIGLFRPKKKLHSIAHLAGGHNFSVVIDGITLRKPFERLFFNKKESPIEAVWHWEDEVYSDAKSGKALKVSGYLTYKRQIRPRSLQGVLIREAGVAIGLYDTTYLEYPFNEGCKFNQLTGELFAEGLSGALNIDRNSFNETDDRYLALAGWFHGKLQREVFPGLKKIQKQPGAAKREENRDKAQELLSQLSKQINARITRIKFKPLGKDEDLLRRSGKTLFINRDHRDGLGSSAKLEKLVLAAAMVLSGKLPPREIEELLEIIDRARQK